jgi:outer membrane protein assembly factor BamB
MNHADPQSTGRSSSSVFIKGLIEKKLTGNQFYISSGLIEDKDSLVYLHSSLPNGGVIAFTKSGVVIWENKEVGPSETVPLISSDGSIYCWGEDIFKLDKKGKVIWKFTTDDYSGNAGLAIGYDKTLYFLLNHTLYALDKNGNLLWKLFNNGFADNTRINISFSPDGKTIYLPGIDYTLYAVDLLNRQVKWKFGIGGCTWNLVDSKGNVYVTCAKDSTDNSEFGLFCLAESGKIKWIAKHSAYSKYGNYLIASSSKPTIDKFGNIYIASDTLYSFNYSGTLNWKRYLEGHVNTSLISNAQSLIYLISSSQSGFQLQGYDRIGVRWVYLDFQGEGGSTASLSLSNDELFIPLLERNILYIIK